VPTPNRTSPPKFSKLAELARSQSVKSDVDPLVRLLPRLMIGDGPSLATPELSETKTVVPKPDVVPRRQNLERIKPVLKQSANQPELVIPRPQITPQMQNKIPAQTEVEVAKKSEPGADAKEIENRPVANKVTKKTPYTGNRKVTVSPGKGLVVVQPGNTLWDLAISIYGSSRYYQKLYRANRRKIKNPQMIFPGQIIFAPDADPPTSIEPTSPPQWSPPQ
jgi:LysM domain-containing protein